MHTGPLELIVRHHRILKRAIDILCSATALIALSPLLFLAALGVLICEGRPVWYHSKRFISPDRGITISKFRTMIRDARSEKYALHKRFMRDGYLDIPINCEVYTRIGRILERSQIVELPQLLRVLTGDMSLIGNRPLPYENLCLLRAHRDWYKRFHSPAGISGIAQVVGKLTLKPSERLALEVAYSDVYLHGSILKCDFIILLQTLRVIVLSRGMSLDAAHRLLRSCLPSSAVSRILLPLDPSVLETASGDSLTASAPAEFHMSAGGSD